MRAAVYLRISQDRTGEGLGVERQEQDCRTLCDRRSWKVADVYCDNDTSAYSGKTRPEWERLLASVRAGETDAIVAWHIDRLTRSPLELEGIITFAEQQGLELATCSGEVDLATATGRMVARILGATARQESERKAERQRREREQSARAGKVAGGGLRPFGYERDGVTICEPEAQAIREAAQRILAGESLRSVSRDLDAQGIRTANGSTWKQPTSLRRILISARISGRREHHGEITSAAVWPAIIPIEDSDRLRHLLNQPERGVGQTPVRTYLLSGILRCGWCEAGLVGRPRGSLRRYICKYCGRIAIATKLADDWIRDSVIRALEGPELRERLADRHHADPDLAASIERDQRKLTELAEAYAADAFTMAEWRAARDAVEARLRQQESRLRRAYGPDPLSAFVGTAEHMVDYWGRSNLSQRRAIVAGAINHVVVRPSTRGSVWDPLRFDINWRG